MSLPPQSGHGKNWKRSRLRRSVQADLVCQGSGAGQQTGSEEWRPSSSLATHSLRQIPSPFCCPEPLPKIPAAQSSLDTYSGI